MEIMNSCICKIGKGMASIGKKIVEEKKKNKKPLLASGLRRSFIKVKPQDVTFPSKQERDDRPVETSYALGRCVPEFQQKMEYLGRVFPLDFVLDLQVPVRVDF